MLPHVVIPFYINVLFEIMFFYDQFIRLYRISSATVQFRVVLSHATK